MKRSPFSLVAASLLLVLPTCYATSAEPSWPADSGPTLSLEQLRQQIQRLEPEQRQELLRGLRPDIRQEDPRPGQQRGGEFSPVGQNPPGARSNLGRQPGPNSPGPNGPNPNGPAPRFNQDRPPGPNGRGPNGANPNAPAPRFAQGRQPGAEGQPPGGPVQRPGPAAQRPLVNRFAEIANLPPEQRGERLTQMRVRSNNQLRELRQAQASGPLTPEQQQRLQSLQAVTQRLDELSKLSPAERDVRLNAMRDAAPGNGQPGARRPGPGGPAAGGPAVENRPRQPFPPAEGDPFGLPAKPAPPGGGAPVPPQN